MDAYIHTYIKKAFFAWSSVIIQSKREYAIVNSNYKYSNVGWKDGSDIKG